MERQKLLAFALPTEAERKEAEIEMALRYGHIVKMPRIPTATDMLMEFIGYRRIGTVCVVDRSTPGLVKVDVIDDVIEDIARDKDIPASSIRLEPLLDSSDDMLNQRMAIYVHRGGL